MKEKEELKKKFDEFLEKNNAFCQQYSTANVYETHWFDEQVLDFFYSEIEAREKEIYKIKVWADKQLLENEEMQNKMKSQSEIIQSGEEVIKTVYMTPVRIEVYREKFERALEKYNSLKEKSNLKE